MLAFMDRFQHFFLNENLERDLQWYIPHRLPEDEFHVLETKTHTFVT